MRYNPDQREWERLDGTDPTGRPDRLLCLAPFRATVTSERSQIAWWVKPRFASCRNPLIRSPRSSYSRPAPLAQPPSGSLKVGFSDRTVTLEALADMQCRRWSGRTRSDYGQTVTAPPPLVIYCTQGEVSVSVDQKQESLTASDVARRSTPRGVKRTTEDIARVGD